MVQFSSRMSQLKGSAIRELLALANKPEVLSFAGGMPARRAFQVCTQDVQHDDPR